MRSPDESVVHQAAHLDALCTQGAFDHYARLVRRFLDVPIAMVTIIEPERQLFVGAAGLPDDLQESRETPIAYAICRYVVLDEEPLVVCDARLDTRLSEHPAVQELGVVAYAGWPILDECGKTVGSLCAIDREPREWTAQAVSTLEDLAHACSAELQASTRQARDSESLARSLVESVDAALVFYDADHHLLLANRRAEQLAASSGFRLDEPPRAGGCVRRADNRTPIPLDEQVIPRALRGDLSPGDMEWCGPPGHESAFVASSQRVLRSDGSFWGTLISGHDVTDLARSIQVREEFVATVSHELRTPLTSIMLSREALAAELDPGNVFATASLDAIRRGALRLQDRIGQLLDTAERGLGLDLRPTDLSTLAEQVAATLAEQARAAGLELAVEAGEPQWAVVDRRRIEQAMENVVSNAAKYTGRGGHITMTVTGSDHEVAIAVSDDGVGMSEDEIRQACDIFWRADTARRHAVPGIGLGLTLVQRIMVEHRGTLQISSRPDRGTTVALCLPRSPAPVGDSSAEA